MLRTLRHEEADRVPISDFFWGSFLQRWREESAWPRTPTSTRTMTWTGWLSTRTWIRTSGRSRCSKENSEEVVVRTGFERRAAQEVRSGDAGVRLFRTDTVEKMAAFAFDDPWDERRYFASR